MCFILTALLYYIGSFFHCLGRGCFAVQDFFFERFDWCCDRFYPHLEKLSDRERAIDKRRGAIRLIQREIEELEGAD